MSPSTLPMIGFSTRTIAEISTSRPGGAAIGGVVTQTGGVSTTTGAAFESFGPATSRRLPAPAAGDAFEISTAVTISESGWAKRRQPLPARSSIASMPPPRSISAPGSAVARASTNRQCSASVASDETSGLATIEPSACTPFSQIRRSNCPAIAAAFRSRVIASPASRPTYDSPSAAN